VVEVRQVAKSERTPRLRMLSSVIRRIGSSELGIVEQWHESVRLIGVRALGRVQTR
jgi:hypothetical protein